METKIRMSRSFARALAVANYIMSSEELQNELSGEGTIYIEAYQNGREQGITVWDTRISDSMRKNTTYYVAENRNSDKVVVYVGPYSMQSISVEAYKHKNYFSNPEEAANWIIEQLISENV